MTLLCAIPFLLFLAACSKAPASAPPTEKSSIGKIVRLDPNGIALSPDEKTLYVSNSDEKKRLWMRYDVAADGPISNGRVFYDLADAKEQGIPDGMKVDSRGNIYAAGPEGIWVFSNEGKHLGTIQPGETVANCGWGNDGKTLYLTASTGIYRIRVNVPGVRPLYQVYQ